MHWDVGRTAKGDRGLRSSLIIVRCPFSLKLRGCCCCCGGHSTMRETSRVESKFKGNGRQRKILSSKCPKWTVKLQLESRRLLSRDSRSSRTSRTSIAWEMLQKPFVNSLIFNRSRSSKKKICPNFCCPEKQKCRVVQKRY